jgi:hypothetical protein
MQLFISQTTTDMERTAEDTAKEKRLRQTLESKRKQVDAIQDKLITGMNLPEYIWTKLVREKNKLFADIELIKRQLQCRKTTGRFHGEKIDFPKLSQPNSNRIFK